MIWMLLKMTLSPSPLPLKPTIRNWVSIPANAGRMPAGPTVIGSTPDVVNEQSDASTEASRRPVVADNSFHVLPPSVEYCGRNVAVAEIDPWMHSTLK